jgi:tetratricopeptide (TPR) repeat protein
MRLLEHKDNDKFSLTKDLVKNVPAYAILSHTWGDDDQEVTYKDLAKGLGKSKAGYQKIQFCGEQATRDGLRHFWVDTCCINKTDAVELQRSINSMFQWYKNASKCYVYLSDVSMPDDKVENDSNLDFEAAFRTAKWFTRGWTLQELLAPSSVEFFSADYKRLGDKVSLERLIHERTGLPLEVLQGYDPTKFSVDERVSWAAKRETKHEEDMVYSLLGIFGVFLPLIYGEGRENAFRRLRQEVYRSVKSHEFGKPPKSRHYHVPNGRLVREFVGRNATLQKIKAAFSAKRGRGSHIVCLRGLGGQGKTQIALEYCRQAREEGMDAIFWVDATSLDTVTNSFRAIADHIKGRGELVGENEVIDYILERFRAWPDPWLMVFDNYDDPKSFDNIRDFLPEGEFGCLLLTSRHTVSDSLVSDLDSAIELEGLSEEDALDLLWKTSRLTQAKQTETAIDEAKRIVDRLAYHPLAVTQAGSYIGQQKLRLDQFMGHYDAKKERILKHTPQLSQYRRKLNSSAEKETSLNVFTTWELSFQQLLDTANCGKEKADLLTLFTFFDHDDICEVLFMAYCKRGQALPHYSWPVQCLLPCLGDFYPNGQDLGGHNTSKKKLDGLKQWASDKFVDIITDLAQMSLVQSWFRGEDDLCHFSLHPLVRDWIQLRTSEDKRQYYSLISGKVLLGFLLDKYYQNRFNLSLSSQYAVFSHIRVYIENTAMLRSASVLTIDIQEERLDLIDKWIGMFLVLLGRYNEAEVLTKRLLDSREKILGSEDTSTLDAMTRVAEAYVLQDKFEQAEELYRKALKAMQKILGPEHPTTLDTMGDIAWVLYHKGNYAAGEEIARAAVEGHDRICKPENQRSFTSFDTLSLILRRQGKYVEAEKVQRRSLVGRERFLGADHRATLIAAMNVASTLQDQGEFGRAEELFNDVLKKQEKILGREHPDTVMCANNLALVFQDQGRLDDAEETMRAVIEINKKVLGQSHSHTLRSTAHLAKILNIRNQNDEALSLYQQAISGLKRALGPEHPVNIGISDQIKKLQEEMGADLGSKTSGMSVHMETPP